MDYQDSSNNSNNFEDSQGETSQVEAPNNGIPDEQIPAIIVLPAHNQTKKHHKSYIEEMLDQQIGLSDLEEVFIKEVNMPFIKLYRVISILGVGAFGVVLEVENMVTKDISALKVNSLHSY
jgi:hypothetical protein